MRRSASCSTGVRASDRVPRIMSSATAPGKITHGLTLKGAQLTWAILHRHKTIENRHIRIPPGWVALHTGMGKLDQQRSAEIKARCGDALPEEHVLPHGFIVGAMRVDRACVPADCMGTPSEPWASGPICNVIGAVLTLDEPVPHKGALGLWRIDVAVLARVQAALAAATIHLVSLDMLPPESAPPPPKGIVGRDGKRKKQGDATCAPKQKERRVAATAEPAITSYFSVVARGSAESATTQPGAAPALQLPPSALTEVTKPLRASSPPAAVPASLATLVAKLQCMIPGVSVSEERAEQALLDNSMSLSRASYALRNGAGGSSHVY